MKHDDLDNDIRELITDSRSLFGDIEEMEKEELVTLLADSGEPANALRDATYARIDALVKGMRMRGMTRRSAISTFWISCALPHRFREIP